MAIHLNLTNSIALLKNNLGMATTEVGLFQDDSFKTSYLNFGQKSFIRDTRALGGNKGTITTDATTPVQEYDLQTITDYLMIDPQGGILFDGTQITYKTLQQLVSEYGESWFGASTSKPIHWFLRSKRYLGLYPTPSTTYVSKTITVYYIKRPADMSAGTDTPFDSSVFLEEYTEAPVLWASWKLLWRAKQYEAAKAYKTEYYEKVALCKQDLHTDEPVKNYLKPAACYHSNR